MKKGIPGIIGGSGELAWILTSVLLVSTADPALAGSPGSGPAQGNNPGGTPFVQKVSSFFSPEEFRRLTRGRLAIDRDVSSEELSTLRDLTVQLPVSLDAISVITRLEPSNLWIGTKKGAILYSLLSQETDYFSGRRWLPDDEVSGITLDDHGSTVWIETRRGFSRIEFRRTSLEEKARFFQDRVRSRHIRHGFTASSRLLTPGDLATSKAVSTDNDGLWTAMYLAAECFRYKVTGDRDALQNAQEAVRALMRLEEITGIPGFPARSIIKVGNDLQPQDGEWHDAADSEWRWKGDTSSDEIVGHYFAYAVYFDLVADDREKRAIAGVVQRITDHILGHDYHLVDTDGRPTRWGWWAPEEIWADPDETGLRALHMLSHLKVARHVVSDAQSQERYEESYQDLIQNHRYHLLTRNQKIHYPGHINHSDDELAFLSYYPLLLYETDPGLRSVYLQSLERSWQVERPERNPLWNFIYAVGSGSREFDFEASIQTLQEIPVDLRTWTVNNSHRLDVRLNPYPDRFKRVQSLIVLPYDELPIMKWNGNPYQVDGGNGGRSEDDGAFFLLPYWMGRYHSLVP